MSDTTIAPGPEIWLRAIGTALAGASLAFAGYMLAYGGGKVRVNGIDHLAIFAQPLGPTTASVTDIARAPEGKPRDGSASLAVDGEAEAQPAPRPARIVAARPDRVWLMIGGVIRSAGPNDDVPGVGRISAIVRRNDGWALIDDRGSTLLTVANDANGAQLFSHKLIFE
jgi:hypothetical protein